MSKYASLNSFLSYLGRYKLRVALVFGSFVIADILLAIVPLFIGELIGSLAAQPVEGHQAILYVAALVVCSSGHDAMWHVGELSFLKLFKPLSFRYENILFRQIIRKPYPYFVDKFTGKISSYINSISQEFREQLEKLFWEYASHIVSLITVVIILTALNWQTGLLFTGCLLLMIFVGRKTIHNSIRYEKVWTDVQSTKNGKIIDSIANFVNVKSFQKESLETRAIAHEQDKTIDAAKRAFLWDFVFWASMGFIVRSVIWPATIILNVYLYLHHEISLTDMTTFLSSVVLFSTYIWDIIWNFSQFTLRMARAEESYNYLFGKANVVKEYYQQQDRDGKQMHRFEATLELAKLNFAYPDKADTNVLDTINLLLKKGEKIGIVGKSGSGKTTITKLLLGYYPVESGQILLDGKPIDTRDLAGLISYVPQDTSLFHRSIADNIAYAADRQVTRDDVIAAAKQAHADEFITQIGESYEALVGERGVKLSAGQRQRIAIARAFLDDKPILVLDEATSALDSESEMLVQEALEALWQHKTVIAIAHRLSTLRHMDRIIVLDKGHIIEHGSHQELIANKGKYAALWAHQSGGFLED